MTREEAIAYGKRAIDFGLNDETQAFCELAIKALEQQPCEDSISRAEAQTEIEMNASKYTISKERGGMGQVEWSDQLIKVSDAVDIIRHLPPVQPKPKTGHWIYDGDQIICNRCFKACRMTKEEIEEIIQQTKAEFLNEEVVKESDLETIQEQSYAKGWNACNRRWIKALDESLSRLQIQLCKPKLHKSQESEEA